MTDIVARLRERIVQDAFSSRTIIDGRLATRLEQERDAAADTIEALQARVKKMEEAINKWDKDALSDEARYSVALDRIRALEEALRPFADVAETLDSETEGVADEDEVQILLHDYLLDLFTVYLFRRARDVLKGEG